MIKMICAFGLAVVVSMVGTRLAVIYAIKKGLHDVPNHRSSHLHVTPRGGGIGVVVATLMMTIVAFLNTPLRLSHAIGVLGGGVAIALLGWVDDHRNLSARTRLLCQGIAALWSIYWIIGVDLSSPTALQLITLGVGTLAIMWMTNLYNFMDGIDGIAGTQGLVAASAVGVLFYIAGDLFFSAISFSIAGACLGFLRWNWAPARIFMGDVGSVFIGYMFGVMALRAWAMEIPLFIYAVPLTMFILDATVTLVRRIVKGDAPATAHREHAYQRLAQSNLSHRTVSSLVGAISAALSVMAIAAFRFEGSSGTLAVVAVMCFVTWYAVAERRRPMAFGVQPRRVTNSDRASRSQGDQSDA